MIKIEQFWSSGDPNFEEVDSNNVSYDIYHHFKPQVQVINFGEN